MRSILIGAAVAVVVMLLVSRFQSPAPQLGGPYPDAPEDPWFQTEVVQPSRERPVLVKFGAEWCGPCRAMDPQLDELEAALTGRAEIVRIDTGERRQLAQHFGISGIPQTFLLSGGRVVDDRTGFQSARELRNWIDPWLTSRP